MCFISIIFPCSPEQKYKNIEKKIFQLLEESILVSTGPKPDVIAGLAKAKEASSMDRTLLRMRNQSGSNNFTHNFDLTYSVSLLLLLLAQHEIAFFRWLWCLWQLNEK